MGNPDLVSMDSKEEGELPEIKTFQQWIDRFQGIIDSSFGLPFSTDRVSQRRVEQIRQNVDDLVIRIWGVNYHLSRIKTLVKETREKFKRDRNFPLTLHKTSLGHRVRSQSFRVTSENRKVLYEFLAFLMALRAATDFIAKIIVLHIPRFRSTRSIARLRRTLQKEGIRHQVASLVERNWSTWIEYIKNYRDDLLHNYSIRICAVLHRDVVAVVRQGKREMKEMAHSTDFVVPLTPKPHDPRLEEEIFTEEKSEHSIIIDGEVHEKDVTIIRKLDTSRFADIIKFCTTYFKQLLIFASNVLEELVNNGMKHLF